jgi:hypothetical protein
VELSEESTSAIRDIANTVETVKGLAASLVEAVEREDTLGVLLALTVAGSSLRDLASGLYVVLADAGEVG